MITQPLLPDGLLSYVLSNYIHNNVMSGEKNLNYFIFKFEEKKTRTMQTTTKMSGNFINKLDTCIISWS